MMAAAVKRLASARKRLLDRTLRGWRPAIIFDFSRQLPYSRPRRGLKKPSYRIDVNKENEAWKLITSRDVTRHLKFLDLGGRDGDLAYLLDGNLALGKALPDAALRRRWFEEHVDYWNADLGQPGSSANFLVLDICSPIPQWPTATAAHLGSFDIVYSNNVFEHLHEPWRAAEHIVPLLKLGGVVITIAPFSLRYHEVPGDYFRYTHTGLEHLFLRTGEMKTLSLGYDLRARRIDWQGSGEANDICPEDRYGAWRENWFVFHAAERCPVVDRAMGDS